MIYALIQDNVVVNIIALQEKNASDFNNAILINDMAISIGDTYFEGIFYREGDPIKTNKELQYENGYNEGYDQAVLDILGGTL